MKIPQSWIDARCQSAHNIVLYQIEAKHIPIEGSNHLDELR
jgi:hypothetical protein